MPIIVEPVSGEEEKTWKVFWSPKAVDVDVLCIFAAVSGFQIFCKLDQALDQSRARNIICQLLPVASRRY